MELKFLKLIKIDHEENQVSVENLDAEDMVRDYVVSIIEMLEANHGDRSFDFKEEELTMQTYLYNLVRDNNRDEQAVSIANRLLQKEKDAQERYKNITNIQRGILIIAYYYSDDQQNRIAICKADYTEFIEEATGKKKNGLPTKKKVFKSFSATVSDNDENIDFSSITTFDSNTQQAKYWYDDFLDLKALHDDKINTKKAYKYIQSKVIDPIKEHFPHEHLRLWNMTAAYFREGEEFSMEEYAAKLANYHPDDHNLQMDKLVTTSRELPLKFDFDSRFTKDIDAIRPKLKKEFELTNDVSLLIKDGVPGLDRIIEAVTDNEGKKYIRILSDRGYELANKLNGNA